MLEARSAAHLRTPACWKSSARNRREGRLHFTTDLPGGPCTIADHLYRRRHAAEQPTAPRTCPPWAVADAIAAHANGPKIVVVKSTVPVGTNRQVAERIAARAKYPLDVASNPEFLKEGAAVDDCTRPDTASSSACGEKRSRKSCKSYTRRTCARNGRSWPCRREARR